MFSRMNNIPEQDAPAPKSYRWKPQEYISSHLGKRGKTCFFGSS